MTSFSQDTSLNSKLMKKHIYNVSELTKNIKEMLEDIYSFIWINGEITNYRKPLSGHAYFTLKDDSAQINCVMFKEQIRKLSYDLTNGITIVGFGRISLYEPRGSYQVIFEYIEPKGMGALQLAFKQLADCLSNEGLFSESHKKQIPFLPKRIGIITSPDGAAIHDILKIITSRYPNVNIKILPTKVQGEEAVDEIVNALSLINDMKIADVAILARGGGSMEDLNAFNSEKVARAIFHSEIPIISAIGHETDVTISDFTADLRASTPSDAAEKIIPNKNTLEQLNDALLQSLFIKFKNYISGKRTHIFNLTDRLRNPRRKNEDLKLKLDDVNIRLYKSFKNGLIRKKESLSRINKRLGSLKTDRILRSNREIYVRNTIKMISSIQIILIKKQTLLRELYAKLSTLDPTEILNRGYSITRTISELKIVKDYRDLKMDQNLEVKLAKGSIIVRVQDLKPEEF